MQKILFLYTELAGYFVSCVRELAQHDTDIHIVRWPVNKEAPFNFYFPDNVKVYSRKDYSDKELLNLVSDISPNLIFCSGWIDKGYVQICKKFRNKIPTVLTMDNHWNGSIKQKLAALMARFTLHRTYNKVWVPGNPQKEYAIKLGYKNRDIKTGFYCADTGHFEKIGGVRLNKKELPKRFVYVGRYIPQKGINILFEAFTELIEEHDNLNWELWCMGTGDLFDQRPEHPKIKHFGFVQPNEMDKYLNDTGVFILPSHFEPWGVVVQEMAVAGFPIICSDAVGAATAYLKDGVNGYVFKKGSKSELKEAMLKVMKLKEDVLLDMANESFKLGTGWTPQMWTEAVLGEWGEV